MVVVNYFSTNANDTSVEDLGFPVGGVPTPMRAMPMSDAGTFRQKRMQKRKNWVVLGGHRRRPPASATVPDAITRQADFRLVNKGCA